MTRRGTTAAVAAAVVMVAACGTVADDVGLAPEPAPSMSQSAVDHDAPTTTASVASTAATLDDNDFPVAVDLPSPRFGAAGLALVDGYVLPILEPAPGGWRVSTPCDGRLDVPAITEIITDTLVIIDPGHGGPTDPGHRVGAMSEASVMLAVAEATVLRLTESGVSAALTRTGDVVVPTSLRRSIIDASGAVVAISIHLGAAVESDTTTAPGPSPVVRVRTDHPESARLGGLLHVELDERMSADDVVWAQLAEPEVSSLLNQRGGEFDGVLRLDSFEVAAVMAELAVVDDSAVAPLTDPEMHLRMADAIAAAAIRQLSTSQRGTALSGRDEPVREAAVGTAPCADPFRDPG